MQRLARRVSGLVFAAVSACAAAPVQSGILVWDGGSRVDSNWGTSLNWNPDQVPANGDGLTFAGSLRTSASNNMSALVVDRLLFQTGASGFSLSGNAFTIRATTPGTGGYIHNSSSSLQTINNAITFDGSGSINYLTTGANGPVTLNGAITLVNGGLTVGGAQTVTLNGAIGGTGTASGIGLDALASLVLLNGANTYTGSTRVFSGSVLRLGNNSRIPDTSALDVAGTLQLNGFSDIVGGLKGGGQVELGSGTLQVSNSSDDLFTGSITGTGMFVKAGSGNLIFGSGTNSYSGGTQILQGTLTVSQFAGNALPDSGAIFVQGGTLKLDKSEVVGTVRLDSGQITGIGALQATEFGLRSGTVSAPLAGTGSLSKTTTGTVILNGSNTYGGSTSISGGTLQLGAANRLPDGTAVSISGGATLNLGTFSDTVGTVSLIDGSITGSGALTTAGVNAQSGSVSAVLAGSAGLTKSGAGTVTLSGANTYTGATVIDAGVLALAGSGQRIADASALSVNSGGIFRMNGLSETVASLAGAGSVELGTATLIVGGTTTFSGVISGSGGLTRQGSGVLTLAGANTYTGTTQVNGGTLALGASNVLVDGSALRVGGGTLDLASFSDLVGSVTLLSGTIQGATGTLRSNAGFVLESGQVSTRLAGDGGLTKNTTGLVTLGSTASYLGATQINSGTLRATAANVLPSATAVDVAAGGILDLNGFSATIGELSGAGTVALGTGATLAVGTNDRSSVFAGTLTGAPNGGGTGGLVKTGAGTLTLTGSVQHTGTVRVSGGTLSLPAGLPLSGRSIEVAAGALAARGFVNRGLTVLPDGAVIADGDLIIGDLAGAGSVGIQGTLDVGSHLVQLVDRAGASSIGGSVLIAQGGRLTSFDQARGVTLLPGGRVAASGESAIDGNFDNRGTVGGPSTAGAFLTFTDDVRGPGAYTGNVRFADGFSPGASPAVVSLENAAFDATSVLAMELGGLLGGAQYDRLDVSGVLELQGGTLAVALIDGFVPQLGNEFDLLDWGQLTGTFGSLALPALAQGLFWETGTLYADGTLSVAAVPEPGTWMLLLAGLIAIGVAADGRRRAGR